MYEVQVLKALVLGEEERGQSQYQVMCFVTKFQKGDFITADAMAKLRQKNPSTIRTPEEDKGKENYTMTGWVVLDRAAPISRHIAPLCSEAPDSTYARDVDLKAWAELPELLKETQKESWEDILQESEGEFLIESQEEFLKESQVEVPKES
ncbi:hypothetical protein RP20_CCG026023 [Aedes albopictus]|nr:hypothetical protein RP20_CCG026023 [Aedes albopictus]